MNLSVPVDDVHPNSVLLSSGHWLSTEESVRILRYLGGLRKQDVISVNRGWKNIEYISHVLCHEVSCHIEQWAHTYFSLPFMACLFLEAFFSCHFCNIILAASYRCKEFLFMRIMKFPPTGKSWFGLVWFFLNRFKKKKEKRNPAWVHRMIECL